MYCIISNKYIKKYLAFQDSGTGNEVQYGYYFTTKETFLKNLANNKKNHPTVFKSTEEAKKFIKWFVSVRKEFPRYELNYEYIDSYIIPKCDMDCWKCNKKNKYKCRHLRHSYQNICGFIMAEFEIGFRPDYTRLDSPCEKCLTEGCLYNLNEEMKTMKEEKEKELDKGAYQTTNESGFTIVYYRWDDGKPCVVKRCKTKEEKNKELERIFSEDSGFTAEEKASVYVENDYWYNLPY